jgi:hypothetical protein
VTTNPSGFTPNRTSRPTTGRKALDNGPAFIETRSEREGRQCCSSTIAAL